MSGYTGGISTTTRMRYVQTDGRPGRQVVDSNFQIAEIRPGLFVQDSNLSIRNLAFGTPPNPSIPPLPSENPSQINNNFSPQTPTPETENRTNELFKMKISFLLN